MNLETDVFMSLICDLEGKKNLKAETPQSVKKGGKTPNTEAKDKSPKSGGLVCKSCSKYVFLQKPTKLSSVTLYYDLMLILCVSGAGLSTPTLVCNNIPRPSTVISDIFAVG